MKCPDRTERFVTRRVWTCDLLSWIPFAWWTLGGVFFWIFSAFVVPAWGFCCKIVSTFLHVDLVLLWMLKDIKNNINLFLRTNDLFSVPMTFCQRVYLCGLTSFPCLVTGSVFTCEVTGHGKTHSLGGGLIRTPLGQPAVVNIDPRKAGAIAETALVEVIGKCR